MRELALHLLDIAENSVAAHAQNITIAVTESTTQDRLQMLVIDDGIGMNETTLKRVIDPFFTSRTTRKVGLGIPFLKQAAEACAGWFKITSTPGKGTRVEVEFQRSHIDRMPLGDLADTFLSLLITSPTLNWTFSYRVDDQEFTFESEPVVKELGDIPLTEPDILSYIRDVLSTGVATVCETSPDGHTH